MLIQSKAKARTFLVVLIAIFSLSSTMVPTSAIDLGAKAKAQEFSDLRFEFAMKIARNPEVFTVASGDEWPYVDATGQFIRLYILATTT